MNRTLMTGSTLALMTTMAVATAVTAQGQMSGDFDLTWNDCFVAPGEVIPDWIGTVDLAGDTYDMVFFNVGDGRPPDHPLPEGTAAFNEVWAVYDGLDVRFGDDCSVQAYEGDLVLWGLDHGTADEAAATYQMTGEVVEAMGPFEGLAGQPLYMSGSFAEDPDGVVKAPGTLVIG